MLQVLKARFQQKYRTGKYPDVIPDMPERYLGLPVINNGKCSENCSGCMDICPVDAVSKDNDDGIIIDLGRCLFCGKCADICPEKRIDFTKEHRMAVSDREDLLISQNREFKHAEEIGAEIQRLLKRSLKLRQVCAGGCNACEADTNVLGTVGFDLGQFGISFVASPRHADGLLITGPVTKNMLPALKATYDAIPDPKIVIAVGACSLSGGLFAESSETMGGADKIIPVDIYVPGCPPHPLTILDSLLTIIKRNNKV